MDNPTIDVISWIAIIILDEDSSYAVLDFQAAPSSITHNLRRLLRCRRNFQGFGGATWAGTCPTFFNPPLAAQASLTQVTL
jgi:hypothetical protein